MKKNGNTFSPIGEVTVRRGEQNIEDIERRNVLEAHELVPMRGATPSAKNRLYFYGTNSAPVNVTDFLDGSLQQTIHILGDGQMTVINGTFIITNIGANKTLEVDRIYTFTYYKDAGPPTTHRWIEHGCCTVESELSIDWSQLTGVPATFPPAAHTHDASAIVSGDLDDARLSANVPLLDVDNFFEGSLSVIVPVGSAAFASFADPPEAFPRWTMQGNGDMSWGSGAAALDVTIARTAANTLGITADLSISDNLILNGVCTSIFQVERAAAAINFVSKVTGDSDPRWSVTSEGVHNWGTGAAAVDTNLYRSAANELATDDSFAVVGTLKVGSGANGSRINAIGSSNAGIWLRFTDDNAYYDSDDGFFFRTGGGSSTGLEIQDSCADTETVLLVRRNVGGVFTTVRVSMGAANGESAGFKALRVPN